jgi:LPS-assembly protein
MRRIVGIIASMLFIAGSVLVLSVPASAQGTLNDSLAARARGDGKAKLLVEAKELIYDNDKNVVSAAGDVELNYQGRTLQADKVIYDRNTNRVFASGNARITEADGTIATGDRFELTDDFKNGFIDSLRVQQKTIDRGTPVTARFSAPRAERINGESTVFDRGTYTACDACKDNPTKPPLWQVKAARIIHNNTERTIYYENATLEFAGVPVAYLPYFWSPDPTLKRKTGFLSPTYIATSSLGTGVSVPFFWAIAPHYDVTLKPTYLSRQGLLMQAEWRHRLLTGSYNVRAAGIFQDDKTAFLPSPLGAREKDFRGSLESTGRFHINERWQYGWDIALLSDRYFLQNYRIRSESLASNYFRESISSLYLTGQGDRSWFDMRGYYFKGLSSSDWQKQQAVVHPVLDYNKRFNGPSGIGGEVAVDVNFTSLTRDAAHFQQIPKQLTNLFTFQDVSGGTFSLYDSCVKFERGQCIVRGMGGTSNRLSTQVTWRRNFVDEAGQVWTPFMGLRADGFAFSTDTSRYNNANIINFLGSEGDEAVLRAMPMVGLEYRYPLVADVSSFGSQVIEPIVQVVARPNEVRIGRLPNDDAHSLVFDDTNIFQWNKFSGYDRVEGGVRANVGAQYNIITPNGWYANALIGQSFQLAGRNSFKIGDILNTGLNSGLENARSDYVTRLMIQPNQNLSFTARGRFDQNDLSLKRTEIGLNGTFNPLALSVMYARYEAQPAIGLDRRREGFLTSAIYNVTPNWFVTGSTVFDMGRYLIDRDRYTLSYMLESQTPGGKPQNIVYQKSPYWTVGSMSLGAGYQDECTTLSMTYTSALKDNASGEKERTQTVLLRLELRTLGQASLSQNFGATSTQDGISQ